MRKGVNSAESGRTTAPSLNGTEGTFQTPGGRCVLKALCDVSGAISNIIDVQQLDRCLSSQESVCYNVHSTPVAKQTFSPV